MAGNYTNPDRDATQRTDGAHSVRATGQEVVDHRYEVRDNVPQTTVHQEHVTSQRTTAVPADGAHATRGARRDAVDAQHARFGGIKWGAAFFGWLTANGLAVILTALLSAAGVALGLSQGLDSASEATQQADTLGIAGGIGLLVVLFLAYLAGGYVAGRMARFDGARQGVAVWVIGLLVVLFLAYLAGGYVAGRMARFDGARQGVAVWVIGLLVVIALAVAGLVLGSQYNVLSQLNLPRIPIDEGTATTAGIITLVAILVVTLIGAVLGGKLGDRYHRKIDRAGFAA
jgi:MFS family permease